MQIRPYGDTANDGIVQLSFTLPLSFSTQALEVARRYAQMQALAQELVAHKQEG